MLVQCWKCVLTLCVWGPLMWPQAATTQAKIDGEWNGTIAGKLRVIIRIDKAGSELESVDQGNAKIPIDEVSFGGKHAVRLELKRINASYEAKLSGDGLQMDGVWQQGGGRVPLSLRRADAGPAASTLKPVTRGSVHLIPCLASDGATQALCGSYEVYENRTSRAGRKIALNLMILPALAEKPAPDPVLAFAGGPGQSAVEAFPMTLFAKALEQQRDIVLIDQRGAGKSNPLPCPLDSKNAQVLINDPYPAESLRACRAALEKHADLTQYTTANAADDADEVREALGYQKVNVVGGSYGSLAALVFLRRHGEHVRSVAIEAVAPPDYRLPLEFARAIQSSLERLFANCAADAGCGKDFPKLKAEFEAVVKRLDREPATFEFEAAKITLSRGAFVSDLRSLLYQPAFVSQLPYILHRAYENDWNPFASAVITMHGAVGDAVARGLAYSVICSESLPFISEADIRRETAGTYLGDFDVRKFQTKCGLWAHASLTRDILAPVHSDVPVLLIAGAEDPATPTWLAEHAAEGLSHGRMVGIPNGTHLTSAACTDSLIAEFVRAGSEKQIDIGCVGQIRRLPFMTLKQAQAKAGQ